MVIAAMIPGGNMIVRFVLLVVYFVSAALAFVAIPERIWARRKRLPAPSKGPSRCIPFLPSKRVFGPEKSSRG